MELPDKLYDRVTAFSEAGNALMDSGDFLAAIEKWQQAFTLLPEPKLEWDAATWLLASIGDAHFQLGEYEAAKQSLYDALNASGGHENPFIYLRLGQSMTQTDDSRAVEFLLKAYMLEGESIFEAEPDGVQYLLLLRQQNLID
jgi:tetratricopeptide (TPR) repeat protein